MTTFGPMKRLESQRGNPDAAFASAPVKVDQTYVTPFETHNPMEPHSTTAIWEGPTLTLYESSQGVVNLRGVLAQMFGLPVENVRVITSSSARGFGSKLWPWTLCPLAAMATRQLSGQSTGAGSEDHVPDSRTSAADQAARPPGGNHEGKLVALQQDYITPGRCWMPIMKMRRSHAIPITVSPISG